ncbi:hypothetical protein ACU9D5_004034 [Cronobacter dublinensis]|uniref:hypothetical protein n=1 Tax=Cronobacter dublinensis TaxID=413497 RepID=UPI000CFF534C|nr:hypothetical protein [Cronobacter dublinensis]
MSLDFFASDHQKNIGQDTSCFVMDEKMHKDIFSIIQKDNSKYRVVPKFKDYYSDSVILFNEEHSLLDELNDIKKKGGDINRINDFMQFVSYSIERQFNIYICCD